MRGARRALLGLGCALCVAAWLAPARGAGDIAPGAYCPLPDRASREAGQKPRCLQPAGDRDGDFFQAVETGAPGDAAVAGVESDLAGAASSEQAYLALSSLAYGYYRLAQQAAATPREDSAIVARLERWNALLSGAYASSADPRYREAVRRAARDLDEHSDVWIECVDAAGETVACRSTEALLRGLDQTSAQVGVRGALQRILQRLFGGDSAAPGSDP